MQDSAALALTSTGGSAKAIRIPRRPLKFGVAGVLVFAGAYGILSEQRYVTSGNAIVSAYVLEVRAPADGTVTQVPHVAGDEIRAGDTVAHLENPLADRQHLDNLLTLESTALSLAAADAAESAGLEGQQRGLLRRASLHTEAVGSRLQQMELEAAAVLAERAVAEKQARTELDRQRQLHVAGLIANQDWERTQMTAGVAEQAYQAAVAELESVKVQRVAAYGGVLSEAGNNSDVTYSRQRADEIAIKLLETRRSAASSQAQAREVDAAVQAEAARNAMLRASDVRSPIDGLVWKLDAMNGERAAAGDTVVSLVDCGHQFLLVEIPQDRLPDVAIGGQAKYRLTGELKERTGTVVAASGDPQKDLHRKFAAFPLQDVAEQLGTVTVMPDMQGQGCAVGRTARVLLPTVPSAPLGRVVRQWF